MKRLVLFLGITIAASAITWVLKAQEKKDSKKTYSVSLTADQWNGILNGLEVVKNNLKTSNMPANQVTYLSDSIIVLYQTEFIRQINTQVQAENKQKAMLPKDTLIRTKKN